MKTNKAIRKLEEFFSFSKKKQKKKHDKFLKILRKLEKKKSRIEARLADEGMHGEASDRHHELSQELKVVSGLIDKAYKLVLKED